jgi:hypothetical protein
VVYKKGAVPISFLQRMNPADVQLVTRLTIEQGTRLHNTKGSVDTEQSCVRLQ